MNASGYEISRISDTKLLAMSNLLALGGMSM
jgi:hypothetical protein